VLNRLFQTRGPATQKLLSAIQVLILGTMQTLAFLYVEGLVTHDDGVFYLPETEMHDITIRSPLKNYAGVVPVVRCFRFGWDCAAHLPGGSGGAGRLRGPWPPKDAGVAFWFTAL